MKLLLIPLALLTLPAMAQLPPMPTGANPVPRLVSPKHAEHMASLGKPMVKAVTLIAAPAPQFITLAWEYPPELVSSVVFEVWHATYLSSSQVLTNWEQVPAGFTLLIEVTGGTNCQVQVSQAADFFIVRARDIATGSHSLWNQFAAVTGPLERVVMTSPTNGQEVSGTITLSAKVITLDPPAALVCSFRNE